MKDKVVGLLNEIEEYCNSDNRSEETIDNLACKIIDMESYFKEIEFETGEPDDIEDIREHLRTEPNRILSWFKIESTNYENWECELANF